MKCINCTNSYYRHGMCLNCYNILYRSVFDSNEPEEVIDRKMRYKLSEATRFYRKGNIERAWNMYCELDALCYFKSIIKTGV